VIQRALAQGITRDFRGKDKGVVVIVAVKYLANQS
jgi:hypothetical protein